MKRIASVGLTVVLLVLGACATPPPTQTYPELTFQHHAPITLNVGSIEVITEYRMPFKAPNVEHQAPIAPSAAMEKWAADVLRASGGANRAVLVITDASIREEGLKKTGGIQGVFKVDQSERYISRIEARIEIRDATNRRLGEAKAFSGRTQTVPEDISANDRGLTLYRLVEATTNDFATVIAQEMQAHLGAHLR